MRIAPAATLAACLVLLLSWLSLRAVNPEAELFDRSLTDIDHFAMLENALYRDVFSARTGTLRNYDPLVHEINALRVALDPRARHVPRSTPKRERRSTSSPPRSTGRKSWSSTSRARTRCCTIRCRSSCGSVRVRLRPTSIRSSAPRPPRCCN